MFKQAFIIGQMLDGDIPDVYVQGEKYWKQHTNSIRSYFSENITTNEYVSLHIRRGDYLKADHFHVDLSKTDYYLRATAMFPFSKFLVFCKDNQGEEQDIADREWCQEFCDQIIPGRYEMAPEHNTEVQDMNLMAGCQSQIGANSSFSWWAAFLNPNPNKVVICPKQWFVDGIQRTELLDSWILI